MAEKSRTQLGRMHHCSRSKKEAAAPCSPAWTAFCTTLHCHGTSWMETAEPKQHAPASPSQKQGAGVLLFPVTWVPPSSALGARSGFLKSSSFSWPWSQPAPLLHPSHSFTGWSHFHNRSPDTLPALCTTLPKRLETICHLLHQHPAITLSPQHKPATPAASPGPASNRTGQDHKPGTASEHSKPGK